MTLKDIEYFLTVANCQNITKAASKLFIAQPALSQCMKKLEAEIGTPLFFRSKNGSELTKAGRCFYDFSKKVTSAKSFLDTQLLDIQESENRSTRLGFSGTLASIFLHPILQEFKSNYPNISVHLVEAWGDEAEEKLLAKEIDLAIMPDPVRSKDINYREFFRDEMILLPSRTSSYEQYAFSIGGDDARYISMDFFRSEPLVTTLPGQKTRILTDKIIGRAGLTPIISLMARNTATVKALALMDIASAIIPLKLLDSPMDRPWFRIPPQYSEPYIYVVATLKNVYITQAMGSLINTILRSQNILKTSIADNSDYNQR